jgi:hypothetical protein
MGEDMIGVTCSTHGEDEENLREETSCRINVDGREYSIELNITERGCRGTED